MKNAQVYAKSKYIRTSVKKVNPVLKLIRGKNIADAKNILEFHPTKASDLVLKVLKSAIANANNSGNLKENRLYISETFVDQGPVRKWGRPVGRGRFSKILKPTSHIVVGLAEREKN